MAEPFIGEIRLAAFSYAPKGWALCNGQILAIAQNQALFSILGTTYGGNGQTTFALPDLRARVPIGAGQGQDQIVTLGEVLGEASHVLTLAEIPYHNHLVNASTDAPTVASPEGALWTTQAANAYASQADGLMAPSAIAVAGGSQAHSNLQPYAVSNYIIALQGIFPSRN